MKVSQAKDVSAVVVVVFVGVKIEPRALCALGNSSTTELHSQPFLL
jgi:hypothetical protein